MRTAMPDGDWFERFVESLDRSAKTVWAYDRSLDFLSSGTWPRLTNEIVSRRVV